MNPASLRRSAPRLAACVAALLALPACDKLMGGEEDKKEDEASAKTEDEKPAEDEKKEDEKKEEDDKPDRKSVV